jgi:hypothetical protein
MNKKNEKIKVTKIHDDEEVDSSYLYEGLKQKKEELQSLKKLIDEFPPEKISRLPKYAQKALKDISEVCLKMSTPFDPKGVLYRLETQEGKQELWNHVSKQCQGKTKEELIQIILNQTAFGSISKYLAICMAEELEILRAYFYKNSVQHFQTTLNRQIGKKTAFSSNKECLIDCYELLVKKINRPIKNTDYLTFQDLVRKKYPKPPVIPKARLTAEEKKMTKDSQDKDRATKERNDWVNSTIRKTFNDLSGLKGTTLKK